MGLLIIAFLLLCLVEGQAQTVTTNEDENGKIAGTVVDAQTGRPIIGANILLVGFSNGDATGINGIMPLLI